MTKSEIKRQLLIIAGTIAVILGVIGIIIPVLPTTPFLLLAAICYTRSSKRLYTALMSNRWLGSYIRNYLEGKGMSLKSKVLTLTMLWVVIICSMVFLTESWILRMVLTSVALGVTVHLVKIKTIRSQKTSYIDRVSPVS